MPIQYKGVNFEHNHVREHVGVFDVSHMAQIIISGIDSFNLVQKLTTNDVSKLVVGKVQYSCMLNQEGGIIDDLLVYCISIDSYMLVVNASNAEKDFCWISNNNTYDVSVVNITDSQGLLSIQGPKSIELLQQFTNLNLKKIPYYSFKSGQFANCEDIIISKTGYTGCLGFEIYMKKEFSKIIWTTLFNHNSILEPIGLAARDTLRLEMGYCLYGNDINEDISPIEAGLSWIVKMNTDFIGKNILLPQISQGVKKCLIGFILEERGVPRRAYEILNNNHSVIGFVTSGTMSPSLKKGLGMGYVVVKESYIGNSIFILIRNKKIKAKIVKRPFYEK
jgi:aminomethyltransferase